MSPALPSCLPSSLGLFFPHSETSGALGHPQISLPSPGPRPPRLPLVVLLDSPSTSREVAGPAGGGGGGANSPLYSWGG